MSKKIMINSTESSTEITKNKQKQWKINNYEKKIGRRIILSS